LLVHYAATLIISRHETIMSQIKDITIATASHATMAGQPKTKTYTGSPDQFLMEQTTLA
jgi:hypothetical protein